jgi:hypothetical protein
VCVCMCVLFRVCVGVFRELDLLEFLIRLCPQNNPESAGCANSGVRAACVMIFVVVEVELTCGDRSCDKGRETGAALERDGRTTCR